MPTVTPVTPSRHAAMRWRRYDSYSFAADRAVVPLVAAELARAAPAFPVAFIQTGKGKGYMPAVVLGLEPNHNLFVAPDGRWLAGYVPAALRSRPFTLRRAADGRHVLCVDEASGLVTDGPQGERFYEDDATLSATLRQVADFLAKVEQNRAATAAVCAALTAHHLIVRWPVARKTDQGERKLEGLFRVNESALNALDDEAFLSLRKSGAVPIAYAQLLSMQQLRLLGELAAARAPRPQPVQLGQDLDPSWLEGDVLKLGPGPR